MDFFQVGGRFQVNRKEFQCIGLSEETNCFSLYCLKIKHNNINNNKNLEGFVFLFQRMYLSEGNIFTQAIYDKNKLQHKSPFGRRGSLIQQP